MNKTKLFLNSLRIKNFKGTLDLEVEFSGKTIISGDNKTGKTTIMDACYWMLFGVNSNDETDRKFGVRPYKEAFEQQEFGDTVVTGYYLKNDSPVELERVLKEKWVKKRGTNETQFKGYETEYLIDGVPKKKKEYDAFIERLIGIDDFKLLSDIKYFSEKIGWDKRREFLLDLTEKWDESDFIKEFNRAENKGLDENMSLEDEESRLKYKYKKLEKSIQDIPARIDEKSNDIIQGWREKLKEKELEKEELQKKLVSLKEQIQNNDVSEYNRSIKKKIKEIEREKQKIIEDTNEKLDREMSVLKKKKSKIEKAISELAADTEDKKQKIESKAKSLSFKQDSLADLREQYAKLNEKNTSLTEDEKECFNCGAELPEKMIEEQKNKYFQKKQNELDRIAKEGSTIKKEVEKIEKEIKELEKENEESEQSKTKEKANLESVKKEIESFQPFGADTTEMEKEIKAQKAKLKIDDKTAELEKELEAKEKELEDINAEINKLKSCETSEDRIEELKKQEKELENKLLKIEGEIYTLEEYKFFKYKAIEKQVNSRFNLVNFRLFEIQKNGGIKNTCEAIVEEVPYSDVNTAGKMKAGVDIINTFSEVKNISVPLWVDNSESISNLPESKNQTIYLQVEKGSQLEVKNITNTNV